MRDLWKVGFFPLGNRKNDELIYDFLIFPFFFKGVSLNVLSLASNEKPETMNEEDFFTKEEIFEGETKDFDLLFQEELKKLVEVFYL